MNRINSIDFVRGLVMVIMALDHVREIIHVSSTTQDPTDLTTTTPALFMTRWITHLCAPIFVFLSGTSAYLSLKTHGNLSESRRFLLKRGLWLVLLNFTVVNFGVLFDPYFGILFSQVIAAIGFGFIGLAALMSFPIRWVGSIGLVIIFGHNLLQAVSFPQGSVSSFVWSIFFQVGFFQITPKVAFLMTYPLVPWLGIMLAGFACGSLFHLADEKRRSLFLQIGCGALLLFALLRCFNFYGDPAHWSFQKDLVFSALSFINTTKYPPSLLYTLMILGLMFLLLLGFDQVKNRFTDIISIYGKVPLFYYLIHWYAIHLVATFIFLGQGFAWSDLQFGGFGFGRPQNGGGLGLAGTYAVWLVIVAAFYPLCKWYSRYKAEHPEKWYLRYV